MKKKVLITGVTGMVGSHLTDLLIDETDYTVIGGCRWRSPLDNIQHQLPLANQKSRLFFEEFDLTDLGSLISVFKKQKPDIIFHLAAQSFPNYSFHAPTATYMTNILGTSNLIEALKILELNPIIHICSSSEVYGRVSKDKLPINEKCNFHPASPYAISKIGTDYIGQYAAEAYKMNTVITRMFTHTGPRRGDIFAESTFAKQIALIENKLIPPIIYTGNLKSLRTWADVRDAVRAYYLLVNSNFTPGESFNIGGNFSCSIEEMLNHLIEISDLKNIQIVTDKERVRPIDADLQVPDTSKFTKLTSWEPVYSFEKTMLDLLNYWRSKIKAGNNYLTR
ncbi:GDP-mannose 4,6-dehydratase [Alphaproteobacteria bacterium]|nr:GDP-mannose 4,6-dehydratase [Alphaproteobacteria bacterium]